MGGASSIDRYRREENVSWWAEELPSKKELEEGIVNLQKNNMTVDYVISHCCGASLIPLFLTTPTDSDILTNYFDHLEFDLKMKFKHWYFGHYHIDRTIDGKYTALYNDIIKICD